MAAFRRAPRCEGVLRRGRECLTGSRGQDTFRSESTHPLHAELDRLGRRPWPVRWVHVPGPNSAIQSRHPQGLRARSGSGVPDSGRVFTAYFNFRLNNRSCYLFQSGHKNHPLAWE